MEKKKVCHTCVDKGFKHVIFWMLPERKKKLKAYCKQNNTTMSELLNRYVNKLTADIELNEDESAQNEVEQQAE